MSRKSKRDEFIGPLMVMVRGEAFAALALGFEAEVVFEGCEKTLVIFSYDPGGRHTSTQWKDVTGRVIPRPESIEEGSVNVLARTAFLFARQHKTVLQRQAREAISSRVEAFYEGIDFLLNALNIAERRKEVAHV
jgi:hypothetical protein